MYKSIDELVERIDERNSDGKISTLIGVSIDKCFINSVANINGTDLTKYKIIHRDDFAVSLMQVSRDSKIPIARLKDYDQAIMSPAYPIFRVRDTSVILPEYLEMWFMRPEFDREAAFIAVGGVRGSMPWEEFAKMRLPVPSLGKQHQIVRAYQIVADRIAIKRRINDNLDATIYAKFQDMFQKNKEILFSGAQLEDWCIKPLSFLADFKYGKMATSEILCEKGFPVYSGYRIVGYCNKYMFKEPQLVVLARGVSGTGEVRISPPCCHLTNLSIAVLLYDRTYINYLLYYLENDNLISLDSGSAQSQITINDLSMHKVMLPPYSKVVEFDNIAKQLGSIIDKNNKEIEVLEELKKVLLTTISSR